MLPRWHIFWGAVITLITWICFPNINYIYLTLMFVASFMIDTDHYINGAIGSKSINPIKAVKYYDIVAERQKEWKRKGIKRKEEEFQFLHTVEVHIIVLLLGFVWPEFFFIFYGMLFHSLLDVIFLISKKSLYLREYSLINGIRRELKKTNEPFRKK